MRSSFIVIAAATLVAGCVDPEPGESVEATPETTAEALSPSCLGTVLVNAPMPAYSAYTGVLPPAFSGEVWIVQGLPAPQSFAVLEPTYAAYQVDAQAGRVRWRAQVAQTDLASIVTNIGVRGAWGGDRPPPPPVPPIDGDMFLRGKIGHALAISAMDKRAVVAARSAALFAATVSDPCLGTIAPAAPMPPISPWTGVLPPAIPGQVWVHYPDGQGIHRAFQVDASHDQVTWATQLTGAQLPSLLQAFASSSPGLLAGSQAALPADGDPLVYVLAFARGRTVAKQLGDAPAPSVLIVDGPSGATNDPTPTFRFRTDGDPAIVECSVDGGAAIACSSPHTTAPLADGWHTLEVRVADAAGQRTASRRSFRVDTVAPTVTITSGPTWVWTSPTTFTFSTSGAPSRIQCRSYRYGQRPAGDLGFVNCSSPVSWPVQFPVYPEISARWTFEVRVRDAAGNTGQPAYWHYWTEILI